MLEITQMKISRNNTDYWCVSKKVEGRPSLKLLGMDVPDVSEFDYSDSTIQGNGTENSTGRL